ncbi:MAG: cadmium-translocating P-type ATPase [Rhizobiaceae bacterium]|nr:cadmium-translocating P-type ATPase [Rhizobiaceae bacterium]
MSCCESSSELTDPVSSSQSIASRLDEERVRAASRHLEGTLYQTDFIVADMHCAACIGTIERGLQSMPQVSSVRANLTNRTVAVVWDAQLGSGLEITNFLKRLGFEANLHFPGEAASELVDDAGRTLLKALAVAGFAAANIMLLSVSVWSGADAETARLFHLISGLIAVPAVAYAGRPFFTSALKALSVRRLNMDVPISLAVLLALTMSVYESFTSGSEAYFDAAVTLLFFLLIGRYLDHLMRQRARGAVDRLVHLTSKGGVLVEDGKSPRYIDLAEISEGMRLRVNPGERLPVDGIVVSGSSDIDRALVTGESNTISCQPGDRLEAGVLNVTGAVDVTTTSDASNSFLAEISSMMDAAERGRGQYVGIADRMAQIYAPAVHILALLTFIGWMIYTGGDWHNSIYIAIAVLIITCPCALGLAVPVVHVIGAHQLMRRGIMMRDGTAFERLAEVSTIAFDKTGTLTMGEPQVVGSTGVNSENAGLVKSIAGHSSHPAARAIAAHLDDTPVVTLSGIKEVPGFGVEAWYQGKLVRLGRLGWVAEIAVASSADTQSSGVAFAMQDEPISNFVLEDRLRPGAKQTIRGLLANSLEVEIVSGDCSANVAATARDLGIEKRSCEMTPAEKIRHIQNLQQSGAQVLMVGDGLNDAPALAAAHVSMAPASASDVGRFAADFVFTRPQLDAVLTARAIALKTGQLVRQNFALAILYNCIAVPLAIAGQITPLIAAIAMSTSSIVVIANSMRLNFYKDRFKQPPQKIDTELQADTISSTGHSPTERIAA